MAENDADPKTHPDEATAADVPTADAPAEQTAEPEAPPKPESTATRGCLRASRANGVVKVEKVDDHCDCSMDLGNLGVKHARDIAELLFAMTKNVR